jgi:hypothetical protein
MVLVLFSEAHPEHGMWSLINQFIEPDGQQFAATESAQPSRRAFGLPNLLE